MPALFSTDATTGDLILTNGALTFTDGRDAIVQSVRTRLRMIAGDSILLASRGLDLELLASGVPLDAIEGALRTEILAVPGVVSVDDATLSADGDSLRTISYDFTATITIENRTERIKIADTLEVSTAGVAGETQALTTE